MKPWISKSMWKHIEYRRLTKNQPHSIQDPAKNPNWVSVDLKVKERASNDKDAFYNKIASEAEAAAYRNDLRRVYASINK